MGRLIVMWLSLIAAGDALFAHFVKNGTWHVPTLTVRRARPHFLELQATYSPLLKYLPKTVTAVGSRATTRASRQSRHVDLAAMLL